MSGEACEKYQKTEAWETCREEGEATGPERCLSNLRKSPATLSMMAALNLPDPYARIDELVERGDVDAARKALSETKENLALRELVEVKIALKQGELAPQLAMNRLLALMRQDAKLPGLQQLYREASSQSYKSGASSLAHSHPPPPPDPGDEGTE